MTTSAPAARAARASVTMRSGSMRLVRHGSDGGGEKPLKSKLAETWATVTPATSNTDGPDSASRRDPSRRGRARRRRRRRAWRRCRPRPDRGRGWRRGSSGRSPPRAARPAISSGAPNTGTAPSTSVPAARTGVSRWQIARSAPSMIGRTPAEHPAVVVAASAGVGPGLIEHRRVREQVARGDDRQPAAAVGVRRRRRHTRRHRRRGRHHRRHEVAVGDARGDGADDHHHRRPLAHRRTVEERPSPGADPERHRAGPRGEGERRPPGGRTRLTGDASPDGVPDADPSRRRGRARDTPPPDHRAGRASAPACRWPRSAGRCATSRTSRPRRASGWPRSPATSATGPTPSPPAWRPGAAAPSPSSCR